MGVRLCPAGATAQILPRLLTGMRDCRAKSRVWEPFRTGRASGSSQVSAAAVAKTCQPAAHGGLADASRRIADPAAPCRNHGSSDADRPTLGARSPGRGQGGRPRPAGNWTARLPQAVARRVTVSFIQSVLCFTPTCRALRDTCFLAGCGGAYRFTGGGDAGADTFSGTRTERAKGQSTHGSRTYDGRGASGSSHGKMAALGVWWVSRCPVGAGKWSWCFSDSVACRGASGCDGPCERRRARMVTPSWPCPPGGDARSTPPQASCDTGPL